MKRLLLMTILFISLIVILPKNAYAFDSNNYKNRGLCGNYELAGFHTDGSIHTVSCLNNYEDARNLMRSSSAIDLAIMTKVAGETVIIDANYALLDLSVNPETLTYFYTNKELTGSAYTYMDTGSLYGGVDGAHLESAWSNAKGCWVAKVKTGNFTGWIKKSTYEIVPITWVKSSSSYTVTSDNIRHNYVAKIQNGYNGSAGSTIGPKPEMLNTGTYYSYDGHYFYTSIQNMISDYKNNTNNNATNKNNPYYNYYMYLSNHTKTAYSSVNIDEYIRNNLGFKQNVYGNAASSGTSRLYGSGTFFYYAQEKYGVNAILSLSLSRNETGNGRSNLAINKNNGFGLNAVDSNPTEAANWYPTFSSSILGYASKWITYGYAHPRDWRYFGPQFGDKWIGMNVKYASDTYWSEKMASNYYNLDKALGLQDYNYYQLGVVNGPTRAYSDASTSSRFIYEYPEKEDALVIVDEVNKNGEKWYKVVSDLNIDNNYNEITTGNYNWNAYVYVQASNVRKINNSKNGYISPNNVYQYKNKNYEYDMYIDNATFKPRVAVTTKNTDYYYDSSLTSRTGKTLLKDRYVIVHTAAYENGLPVSYLVSSDYFHDQKEWIKADSIKFTNTSYGKVSVTVSGNQYTWVNYNREDASYSLISGLYTNTYVPVLESSNVGGLTWYKVPVSLTDNNNVYGYTLAQAPGVNITLSTPIVENNSPVIIAVDKTIMENTTFNEKENVSATDPEDGDITNKIQVIENTVNTKIPGEYKVKYKVVDSNGKEATKEIKVIVKENKAPVISAEDKELIVNDNFNEKENVSATDPEDGDITNKIQVIENTVNTKVAGEYKVKYKVVDSNGKEATKEIIVTVKEQNNNESNNEEIIEEDINVDELLENLNEGEFYLESLTWDNNTKKYTISGYCIINDKDNSKDKEYALLFINKDTDEVYINELPSWNDNTPYDLGDNYHDAWFKGELDFTDIPNGDYELYLLATTKDYYTIQIVDNFFNQDIQRRAEDNNHGYNFKVLENLKSQALELSIRDELYTTKESPTYRNMTNEFEQIEFKNNKLLIEGYSYNYNGDYSNQSNITRKIIFENTKSYKQTVIDIGSSNGPYELKTKDNLAKTYAWYNKEIDISNLEKGTYSIMIYTKTSNAEDYGELTDMFEELSINERINNKTYKITYNKDRQSRVELTVE